MHGRQLRADEKAVSPVIGAVLLIAITVVLAATAGAMLLSMGDGAADDGPPETAWDFNYGEDPKGDDEKLDISHASGDTVTRGNIKILVEDAECAGSGCPPASDVNREYTLQELGLSRTEVTAGTTAKLRDQCMFSTGPNPCDSSDIANAELVLENAKVSIIWRSSDGSKSQTLTKWHGPGRD